jgi:hypothetical protein
MTYDNYAGAPCSAIHELLHIVSILTYETVSLTGNHLSLVQYALFPRKSHPISCTISMCCLRLRRRTKSDSASRESDRRRN